MNPKTKTEIKKILWLIIFIALLGFSLKHNLIKPLIAQAPADRHAFLPKNPDKPQLEVRDKIIIYARQYGVNINEALDIAWCESRFNEKAKNWKGSTARGIYQFLFSTWDNYCEGDVKNADDNIKCFMRLYPKHKNWWTCARLMGYTSF